MALLIVHPGTGTIIDVNDGTLIVDIPDTRSGIGNLDEEDIILYAERWGKLLKEEVRQWRSVWDEDFDLGEEE